MPVNAYSENTETGKQGMQVNLFRIQLLNDDAFFLQTHNSIRNAGEQVTFY